MDVINVKYAKCALASVFLYASNAHSEQVCSDLVDSNERLTCYDETSDEDRTSNNQQEFKLDRMNAKDISDYFNDREIFQLAPHQPNYILPVSYNSNTNDDVYQEGNPGSEVDEVEVKFQLSGRLKVIDDMYKDNWDLWFGYTHTSWWQLYNSDESAPFRETNYSPEIFTTYYSDYDVLGLTLLQTEMGFVHQSNGRTEPLSRSWNRIYADFQLAKGNYLLSLKPWYRIPEDEEDDDNPNIEDYVGYGDYRLTYKGDKHLYSVLFRNNFKFDGDNRSSFELSWAFPAYDVVDIYLQYYNGYGESMIDYDHRVNRISLGILIYDWF